MRRATWLGLAAGLLFSGAALGQSSVGNGVGGSGKGGAGITDPTGPTYTGKGIQKGGEQKRLEGGPGDTTSGTKGAEKSDPARGATSQP